jgi:hypothetical protein
MLTNAHTNTQMPLPSHKSLQIGLLLLLTPTIIKFSPFKLFLFTHLPLPRFFLLYSIEMLHQKSHKTRLHIFYGFAFACLLFSPNHGCKMAKGFIYFFILFLTSWGTSWLPLVHMGLRHCHRDSIRTQSNPIGTFL